MAFITAAIIDAAIGAPLRAQVTDNSQSVLTRKINEADARARADLKQAGYTVSPSVYNVTPDFTEPPVEIQHASIGYFIRLTFPRRQQPTDGFEAYLEAGPGIANGTIQPYGLSPDEGAGVGAARFTDYGLDTDFEPQMSRDKLRNF